MYPLNEKMLDKSLMQKNLSLKKLLNYLIEQTKDPSKNMDKYKKRIEKF